MPLIDPGRLLKTLAPLLEPSSGAIKSDKEVDKIYGLMSKFSKKLVSKCTYINILRASDPEILDLFLQRGGWDMVLGWTLDANNKKNYEVLKEIGALLLYAPASVQRLKENELPKVVKSLSKDCENDEIREIAKQIVSKWIAIAKQQDHPTQLRNIDTINSSTGININSAFVQSGSSLTTSSSVSSRPGLSMVRETTDNHSSDFDITPFDISQAELNDMIDFNPEDFTNAVDQHLCDFSGETTSRNDTVNSIGNDNPQSVKIKVSPPVVDDSNVQKTPKLLIKTVGGQKAVVQSFSATEPIKQDAPFCIMMKDGKPFLVRLKLASAQEVNSLGLQPITNQDVKVNDVLPEKVRRPRKDPSITSMKKTTDERHIPAILKTYSKKNDSTAATLEKTQLPDVVQKNKSITKETKSSETKPAALKKPKAGSASKSGSAAALAAAKKQADEEKLKDKIKQEKIMLKKRAKDVAKQKQQEKDQETLKKLNLGGEPSNTSPGSMKIPKIPKKQSSFADAIGIPGSGSSEFAIPVTEKSSKKNLKSVLPDDSNELKKVQGKKDETEKSDNNERRHRVKVFTSKKSRADDLLKDMTENAKNNKLNKSETSKGSESVSILMGDKSLASNSLILKPEKRPSIEGIEKPGDAKKLKLSDEKLDKRKDKESNKASTKEKIKPAVKGIKESSLFMDALAASTEAPKAVKRKRRLSSSNENCSKEIVVSGKSGRRNSITKDKPSSPTDNAQESVKPVFNFYRETLEDSENLYDEVSNVPTKEDQMEIDISGDQEIIIEENNIQDAFLPTEDELKLKSALVIHRTKANKPKKSVRWREDDELKEVFTFELNEDERVNVTKLKDFSAMKEHEKAEEKEYLATKSLKRRILGEEDADERIVWRKPYPLLLIGETIKCTSEEKAVQEERERLNLGMFLPPGSTLPDTPCEPDPLSPDSQDRFETKLIPVEDVLNVTKVYDKTDIVWPKPSEMDQIRARPLRTNISLPFGSPDQMKFPPPNFHGTGDISLNTNINGPMHGFQNPPPPLDFNNPWNMAASSTIGMTNMSDISGFPNPGNLNMARPPPIGFPPGIPNPFGFPIQNPVPNFPPPGMNFPGNPNQMVHGNNNMGRESNRGLPHNNSLRGRGISVRDYGDRDLRRTNSHESRSREAYDARGKSRDYNRSRDNDRDRDRRSPSPNRRRRDDRDRYGREDKDYRDHDFRSRGRSGKKDVPCRYFRKGHCHSGNHCEFSHGEPSSDYHDKNNRKESSRPSGRQLSPSLISGHEDSSGHSSSSITNSITSMYERRPSKDETEATNFVDAPSSPANEIAEDPSLLLTTVIEPAKIIPVE